MSRVSLSVLQTATLSTNLSSSVTVLYGSGAFGFTLDITNETYFIVNSNTETLIGLDLVTNNVLFSRAVTGIVPKSITSYQYIVYTITPEVPVNLFFYEQAESYTFSLGKSALLVEMFWNFLQPLPGKYSHKR